ncbi:hypothetical protein [Pontibacterium sp.]|uniref:hypothetical protein n=1 Tax=Pontibacterium sp. TaxID=2036026 RepID=UPI003514EB8A
MKLQKILMPGAVLTLTAALVGCYGNSTLPEQGEGYHEMVERQTAYPDKMVEAGNPPLDGTVAARVVKTYRADAAERDSVRSTINVNIGK